MRPFVFKRNFSHPLTPLKWIILATVFLSLFSTLFDALFPYFNAPRPQILFSLSLWGLKQGFFWQLVTYFFMSPPTSGVNLSLILYLLFNMYFLWIVGSSVIAQKGTKHFLILYLGGGVFSGIISAILLWYTQSATPIAGVSPAFFALLTAWAMLLPEVEILLFFTIPLKIKWLIPGILGISLVMDLSQGDFLNSFSYASATAFGYLFSLLAWKTLSPFAVLHPFEKAVIGLNKAKPPATPPSSLSGKIYDFQTGNPIFSEEAFLNACLDKIALHGKHSLTWMERWKMRKISKRKRRQSR